MSDLPARPPGTTAAPWHTTRREDERLLRGTRHTVADLPVPGVVELAFARSRVAHATLHEVDVTRARQQHGVLGAWSAAELAVPDVPGSDADAARPWPPLARGRVRYFGEALAVVAATDRYTAEDGCDAVRVVLDELPACTDPREALGPDAPHLWDGGNLVADVAAGDELGDVLRSAPVVVDARYREQLVLHTSMEARAIAVRPDDDGGLTVWVSHQGQHLLRDALAAAFGLEPRRVRVIVPETGGAFGGKSGTWPEYLVVVAVARELNRPVRWTEDRREALENGPRGRGQWQTVRLAAGRDGRLLGLDLDIVADIGGYPAAQGAMVPAMTSLVASGCYDLRRVHVRTRTVATTTAPTSAYRGAGRPEAAYQLERTMDVLASRLGLDPAELRRRNFLPSSAMPHTTPTGAVYDSGDYAATFDRMLTELDYTGLRAEQARRRAAGDPALGIGLCCYVERSGAAAHSPEWAEVEALPDGSFVARSGSTATGQGHDTAFPQVVGRVLGVDADRVRLIARDTREVREGHGSFGSRSMQVGGGALWRAGETLVRLARERAAAHLGVPTDDVTYDRGRVAAGGTVLSLGELAAATGPLRAEDVFTPPQAFPFGCYGAVVEVDATTGSVDVRRVVAVDDYGVVVNPMIVEGQTVGSIAQGLGQALYENADYGPDGRPPASTLLDYLVPTAAEMPDLVLAETESPNPNQPFGAKGAGEAGCIGVPPALLNAVADALGVVGDAVQLPATPERVRSLAAGSGR